MEQLQGNFSNKQNFNSVNQKICRYGDNCKYRQNGNCRFTHIDNMGNKQYSQGSQRNNFNGRGGNGNNGQRQQNQNYQQRRNQNQDQQQQQFCGNFNNQQRNQGQNSQNNGTGSQFEVKKLENGSFQVDLVSKCEYQGQCQNLMGLCRNFHQQRYILSEEEIKKVYQVVKEKELLRKQKIVQDFKNKQFNNISIIQKSFVNLWYMVDSRIWKDVIQNLQLKEELEVRNIKQQIMNKLRAQEIGCDEAFQFYSTNELSKQEKRDYINELIKQRKISKARTYAVEFGFDPQKDFEHIQYQAGIGFIGYNLRELKKETDQNQIAQKIQHMETIYNSDQKQNFYYLQTLGKFFLKEFPDQVYSQFQRFQQEFKVEETKVLELFTNQNYSQKQNQISDYQNKKYNYVKNAFIENKNIFGPGEEISGFTQAGTYLNMSVDGGISEKNVYFIYEIQSEHFQFADKTLRSSKLLGFDSESCVGFESGLALYQISTENEVFIFDIIAIQKQEEIQQQKFRDLIQFIFEQESILIIGQTIFGDMKGLKKDLGSKKDIDFKGIVDISDVFFECFSKESKHGLAFICEKFLPNRKLSKIEQCSGWHQRPLRKSQLHYAALDAYICLRLWLEAKKQFPDLDIDKHIRDVQRHENVLNKKKQNRNQKQFEQIMEENKIDLDESNQIDEE